jgi:hypothetical protein
MPREPCKALDKKGTRNSELQAEGIAKGREDVFFWCIICLAARFPPNLTLFLPSPLSMLFALDFKKRGVKDVFVSGHWPGLSHSRATAGFMFGENPIPSLLLPVLP